ncbi:hypothetical protein B0J12DRAFT_653774 [Macrophomina phaseolina]|uniref:Uncharacterized protein n=1 Tax=Macrophomina phaseolina TaxID=35725 RepID=A0ABQ8GIY6_9PEZI|nr:hypothetical protein B0J12DRAFT_653774 [Macrophomina phaseolina]
MRFEITLLALIAAVAYAAPAPIPEANPADVDNADVDSVDTNKLVADHPTWDPKLNAPPSKEFLVLWEKYKLLHPLPQQPTDWSPKKKIDWKREAEPAPEAEAVAVAPDNKDVDNYWPRPNWQPNPSSPDVQITQQQYLQYLQYLQNSGNTFNGGILNNVLSGNNLDISL